MTAITRKFIFAVSGVFVASPSLAILLDFGPMGYHHGTALFLRVLGVLLATTMLATVITMAGYLYWLHVIAPAPPAPRAATRQTRVPGEVTLGQLTIA